MIKSNLEWSFNNSKINISDIVENIWGYFKLIYLKYITWNSFIDDMSLNRQIWDISNKPWIKSVDLIKRDVYRSEVQKILSMKQNKDITKSEYKNSKINLYLDRAKEIWAELFKITEEVIYYNSTSSLEEIKEYIITNFEEKNKDIKLSKDHCNILDWALEEFWKIRNSTDTVIKKLFSNMKTKWIDIWDKLDVRNFNKLLEENPDFKFMLLKQLYPEWLDSITFSSKYISERMKVDMDSWYPAISVVLEEDVFNDIFWMWLIWVYVWKQALFSIKEENEEDEYETLNHEFQHFIVDIIYEPALSNNYNLVNKRSKKSKTSDSSLWVNSNKEYIYGYDDIYENIKNPKYIEKFEDTIWIGDVRNELSSYLERNNSLKQWDIAALLNDYYDLLINLSSLEEINSILENIESVYDISLFYFKLWASPQKITDIVRSSENINIAIRRLKSWFSFTKYDINIMLSDDDLQFIDVYKNILPILEKEWLDTMFFEKLDLYNIWTLSKAFYLTRWLNEDIVEYWESSHILEKSLETFKKLINDTGASIEFPEKQVLEDRIKFSTYPVWMQKYLTRWLKKEWTWFSFEDLKNINYSELMDISIFYKK